MKTNKILIFLGLLTVTLHAQEETTYWDNGKVKSVMNYSEDGHKTGYWANYYQTGHLEEAGSYESGEKYGDWNEYYHDGTTRKTTYYINGKINELTTYYEGGSTMVSGYYDENGEKHGTWNQYYKYWDQKLSSEYAHGQKHGRWNYYTEDGNLFKIENYNKGLIMSKWEGTEDQSYEYAVEAVEVAPMVVTEEVDESEEIVEIIAQPVFEDVESEVEYIEETEEKVITYIAPPPPPAYDAVVEVKEAVAYSDEVAIEEAVDAAMDAGSYYYGSRLNGVWEYYNENGNVIETGSNKYSKKDGKWISYYDNGQVKKEQLWEEGKLMEVTSYFDTNGKSLDKGTLKDGNGTVKEYDVDGKLIATIDYNYGEELDWNNANQLNSLAWGIYENKSDSKSLNEAIKLVKRSIELDKNYYNTDTYAALLYKTGNYKQALTMAENSIKIAKKEGDDYRSTTELIEKIKKSIKK